MSAKIAIGLIFLTFDLVRAAVPASLTRIYPGETPRQAAARQGAEPIALNTLNIESATALLADRSIPYAHAGGWHDQSGDFILHSNGSVHLMDGSFYNPAYTLTARRAAPPASSFLTQAKRSALDSGFGVYLGKPELRQVPMLESLQLPASVSARELAAAKQAIAALLSNLPEELAPVAKFRGDEDLFGRRSRRRRSGNDSLNSNRKKAQASAFALGPSNDEAFQAAAIEEEDEVEEDEQGEEEEEEEVEVEGFGVTRPNLVLPKLSFFIKVPARNIPLAPTTSGVPVVLDEAALNARRGTAN